MYEVYLRKHKDNTLVYRPDAEIVYRYHYLLAEQITLGGLDNLSNKFLTPQFRRKNNQYLQDIQVIVHIVILTLRSPQESTTLSLSS